MFGAPYWTRTSDPQLRRLLLYPTELRAQRRVPFIVTGSPLGGGTLITRPTFSVCRNICKVQNQDHFRLLLVHMGLAGLEPATRSL